MKLSLATFSFLALVASSNAQYFSAGWSPGEKQPDKPVTSISKPFATATAAAEPVEATNRPSLFSLFDINNILTSGPSVALFNRFGINITERVQTTLLENAWDGRVSLITDDNYEDLIVNEALTEQEEKDRVWLIVISVTASKSDGISKYLDNVFDAAFNETLIAGDLLNVKWGRIDYFNVTRITTKWGVWQAPRLVVLKDRGRTLRFYRPQQLRLKEDALREFLRVEGWTITPPWSSSYAPGGSNEYLMDFFAIWMTKVYNYTLIVPRWLLVFASGTLASVLIGFLHKIPQPTPLGGPRNPTVSTTTAAPKTNAPDTPVQSDRQSAAPQAKRTGAKQRKGKV